MPRSDNAPIGYTCGTIDNIISAINSMEDCGKAMFESDVTDEEKKELWSDIAYYAMGGKRDLESVRKDNDTLRTWGNGLYQELEDFKEQYDDMESKYEDLLDEIDSLKEQLEKMSLEVA